MRSLRGFAAWFRVARVHLEAIGLVAGCTVVGLALLSPNHLATVSCLYLTAIIITTLRGGLSTGILASILSFVVMDYSFIPPVYQVDLRDPVDWVAIVSFLVAVGIIHWLLERARAEAKAANEAEVLRRSDELKTTLLALVGHELQTPLTVIKTAASSLYQDGSFDRAAVVTLTHVINRESDRLHHVVSNLLDLSRIDGGALHLALDWYDLGELAREAVDRLRAAIGDQPVEVIVDEDLLPIRVDYLLFDRVVANLVLNAVRYAPSEAPIRVVVERCNDQIHLRVTDHGPGIPSEDLGRIFERFYRRGGPWSGAGLGLALCKAIVEAHGGRIWAEPPADGTPGLTICLVLPLTIPRLGDAHGTYDVKGSQKTRWSWAPRF
jgi:K+-sensing histidine kinase KdpD